MPAHVPPSTAPWDLLVGANGLMMWTLGGEIRYRRSFPVEERRSSVPAPAISGSPEGVGKGTVEDPPKLRCFPAAATELVVWAKSRPLSS